MVVTAQEAIDLIKVRDKTGKLLVIAFNGSLSPQVRAASRFLQSGDAGKILNINAMVWENWSLKYEGHWKQNRAISGGGFLFDCGAHMLNTVSDLVGEAFTEVTAWLDNRDKTIDIIGSIMARTQSGILVSMTSCGEVIPSIGSEVHVFCTEATVRTGIWGERLEIQRRGESELTPVEVPPSLGVWEQFLAVRNGAIENPSPPEIGLRMALLWDAIQASAANGGELVKMKPISELMA
jgi:predicted dehydrogenase